MSTWMLEDKVMLALAGSDDEAVTDLADTAISMYITARQDLVLYLQALDAGGETGEYAALALKRLAARMLVGAACLYEEQTRLRYEGVAPKPRRKRKRPGGASKDNVIDLFAALKRSVERTEVDGG